tara:strand:+ start:90286 stop:90393 length:108 start_codon:yes stop_codon:yes gene_type:complete
MADENSSSGRTITVSTGSSKSFLSLANVGYSSKQL